MEKVLITGGAGYIGCVLTEFLLNKGYSVTVLDNLCYQQKQLIQFSHHNEFSFIYGDVRDKALLSKILPHFSVIIPLAAIVGAPACEKQPEAAQIIH